MYPVHHCYYLVGEERDGCFVFARVLPNMVCLLFLFVPCSVIVTISDSENFLYYFNVFCFVFFVFFFFMNSTKTFDTVISRNLRSPIFEGNGNTFSVGNCQIWFVFL